jgi:glycerophosphoryl diester phosphodiesterase
MKKLTPLPDYKRPLIFAHRGISSEAPENTMASFKMAKDKGIPGIEIDIHITKDDKLVVIHDYSTKRTSPGTDSTIETSLYSELSGFDIGSWKDPQYKNERILLLSELFEELGNDLYFDIEIKSNKAEDKGLEALLVKTLKDFNYGQERIIVCSFNPIALKRFKSLCPNIPTAILYIKDPELPWYLRRGEGDWIANTDVLKPEHKQISRFSIVVGRRNVLPWTIDDKEIAKKALEAGCVGIVSNTPHTLEIL